MNVVSLDAMPNYPHILFNKSPEELRRQGSTRWPDLRSQQPSPPCPYTDIASTHSASSRSDGNHGRSHHHPQRTVSMAACCGKARVRPTNNVKRDNPARGYCDFKLRGTLNILKPPPTKK